MTVGKVEPREQFDAVLDRIAAIITPDWLRALAQQYRPNWPLLERWNVVEAFEVEVGCVDAFPSREKREHLALKIGERLSHLRRCGELIEAPYGIDICWGYGALFLPEDRDAVINAASQSLKAGYVERRASVLDRIKRDCDVAELLA